jgi:ParB family transcriptional regulator, chromosome partitioning protein
VATMRQALGKGIGALIPSNPPRREAAAREDSSPSPPTGPVVQLLPVGSITANPRQPRAQFDEASLAELSRSVAEQGVLQPILVRQMAPGRFELIAGERRLRAARLAGLGEVPVLVKEANDHQSLVLAIVENVQRADLSPLEEAQAYQSLIEEYDLTQDEVAKRVGKSRPAISNTLRLLQLPEEIRSEIAAGRLTAGHARALLALDQASAQTALAREVITRRLSVRDTEKAAANARQGHAPSRTSSDPDVKRIETDLSRALGTKVTVHTARSGTDGKGHLAIEYYSNDDLARLVALLAPPRRRGAAERP